MATVIREIVIDAAAERVWDAIGDFAGGPMRTSPGAFVGCTLEEPGVRALTFADGKVVRERLIGRDDQARRIVWAWIDPGVAHDNTSMQVFDEGGDRSRVVWIHDTMPDDLSGWLASAMDDLVPVLKRALESDPR